MSVQQRRGKANTARIIKQNNILLMEMRCKIDSSTHIKMIDMYNRHKNNAPLPPPVTQIPVILPKVGVAGCMQLNTMRPTYVGSNEVTL